MQEKNTERMKKSMHELNVFDTYGTTRWYGSSNTRVGKSQRNLNIKPEVDKYIFARVKKFI